MMRIVVADNDPDALDLALTDLRLEGHEVYGAYDAAGAQELVRSKDPDVVVLDYRMPGLSGIETATAMLAEEPGLPIVLYSAFPDPRMVAEAQAIGVRACVEKGDAPRLIGVLRELTQIR